jgi:LacI family transcriptional regulator
MQDGKNVNIKDIAHEAGVSISTVSRVLNGTKAVSDALTLRVRDIVKRYDYAPDPNARTMVLGKTNTIGLVMPDVSLSFFNALFLSLNSRIAAAGFKTITCTVRQTDNADELAYLDLLRRKHVDGIILMHESNYESIMKVLRSTSIPLVLSTVEIGGLTSPTVGTDEYQAAFDGTQYLLGLGHTSIAFINGSDEGMTERKRRAGYLAAMTGKALEPLVTSGDYTLESGRQAALRFLSGKNAPTAIFAASDEMAIGAMKAAWDMGLSVPGQISVLGFDDITVSGYTRPPLTTVRQDTAKIAEITVSTLLDIMEHHPSEAPRRIIIPHTIIVRESCTSPSTSASP